MGRCVDRGKAHLRRNEKEVTERGLAAERAGNEGELGQHPTKKAAIRSHVEKTEPLARAATQNRKNPELDVP